MKYPRTPELDKLKAVAPYSQKVGEFVNEFLAEKGIMLGKPHVHDRHCQGWDERRNRYNPSGDDRCSFNDGEFQSVGISTNKLLAEFFGIKEEKCERERLAILEHLRKQTETTAKKGKG